MNAEEQKWFTLPMIETLQNRHSGIGGAINDEAVAQFNILLRGEIAAVEIYRRAIDKLIKDGQDPGWVAILREIQREHMRANQVFRKRISELGGVCDDSSGSWGIRVAMGAAQLFGDHATLHALRDCEEHVLKEMKSASEHLDADSVELLEKVMIPAQARHIRRISTLLDLISA